MAELSPAMQEYLRKSRLASGVPEKVTDPATISQLVSLLLPRKAK